MRKKVRWTRNVLATWGILCTTLILSILLYIYFPLGHNEIHRITSPDKKYDVVIVQHSPIYIFTPRFELFIVPAGTKYSQYNDKFSFGLYQTDTPFTNKIKWEKKHTLIIHRSSNSPINYFDPEQHNIELRSK